jgi:hypothetical protein
MTSDRIGTPSQQRTIEELVEASGDGVFARELEDGSLEVLTRDRGELGRHRVSIDGSAVLLETRPTGWRRWGGPLVWCLGFGLFIGFGIALGIQDSHGDATWWTIVPMLVGFAGWYVAFFLLPGPHQLARRGEKWARLGFPED